MGCWYVTGTHGTQKHLGNLVIRGRDVEEPVDNSEGQNVTDLKFRINPDRYLSAHSDIVALMVLEHQLWSTIASQKPALKLVRLSLTTR